MSALREPAFRLLWSAGLISDTGDWLLLVALPILVYQLTHSALGTGTAFLAELVPAALLAPLAGWTADRLDRRRVLTIVPIVQAAVLVPLAFGHALIVIYAVLAAEAALSGLFEPAKNALLPTLAGSGRLVSANSLIGLNQNLGRLAGAPIGGVLLALGGAQLVVAVDGVSFLAAALLISRLRPASGTQAAGTGPAHPASVAAPGSAGPPRREWWAPPGALTVTMLANAAQGMFVVLFVVFVERVLHGGAAETGLLRGVQAIGALCGGLLLTFTRRLTAGRLIALGALASGAISLACWNTPRLTISAPPYVALFIAAGFPGIFLLTGLVTWFQESQPDERRGRAFAGFSAATAAGQALGALGGGILGDQLSVVTALDSQAVIYLLAGVLALALLRPPARVGVPAQEIRAVKAG